MRNEKWKQKIIGFLRFLYSWILWIKIKTLDRFNGVNMGAEETRKSPPPKKGPSGEQKPPFVFFVSHPEINFFFLQIHSLNFRINPIWKMPGAVSGSHKRPLQHLCRARTTARLHWRIDPWTGSNERAVRLIFLLIIGDGQIFKNGNMKVDWKVKVRMGN